jgi:hypothetical protein
MVLGMATIVVLFDLFPKYAMQPLLVRVEVI